jgi:hypothetical protein
MNLLIVHLIVHQVHICCWPQAAYYILESYKRQWISYDKCCIHMRSSRQCPILLKTQNKGNLMKITLKTNAHYQWYIARVWMQGGNCWALPPNLLLQDIRPRGYLLCSGFMIPMTISEACKLSTALLFSLIPLLSGLWHNV